LSIRECRVVVTGGAGFIGSHLVDRLLAAGNEVIVIDDFSSGSIENLSDHANNPELIIERADVLNEAAMFELIKGAEFVFHLATRNVRLSLKQPTIVHEVNTTGTFNVLKASSAARVRRFLYCSSSEVNGTAGIVPMTEEYNFNPETIYGASKLAGEYYTEVFHRAGWVDAVIARPHNNYGPRAHYKGHSGEVIPRFILSALAGKPLFIYGDGTQTRDFTYVTETADFLVRLLECDGAFGKVFNICRGCEVSIVEIANHILDLTGSKSRLEYRPGRPADVMRLYGDPSQLKTLMSESPAISIRDGLEATIEWFKNNVVLTDELFDTMQPENWADIASESWMNSAKNADAEKDVYSRHGGKKVFVTNVPVTIPKIGYEEATAAGRTIYTGWVTQGPTVGRFEKVFCAYTESEFACAVANCTAALQLALITVGVKPGDVVLTVSHSFIATANAIRHCMAEPVFVDIESDTMNMDPADLSSKIEEYFEKRENGYWYKDVSKLTVGESPLRFIGGKVGRLAAILVVHQVGMPADMVRILKIARGCGVPVVEDAACALGSAVSFDSGRSWENIGRPHGDIACFSLHPRKVITTGEGGMLTTDNSEYDKKLRLLRHQGMSVSDFERHNAGDLVFEDYVVTGYNFRMTDIQASIGIEQLKRLPEILERRRHYADEYNRLLKHIEGIRLPSEPDYARTNWQSYIIRLSDMSEQKQVMSKLLKAGISVRRGIMCAHLEAPYAGAWRRGSLPVSESVRDCGITLPLYPDMDRHAIERVVAVLYATLKG